MPPDNPRPQPQSNRRASNGQIITALGALTDQIEKLNGYFSERDKKSQQSRGDRSRAGRLGLEETPEYQQYRKDMNKFEAMLASEKGLTVGGRFDQMQERGGLGGFLESYARPVPPRQRYQQAGKVSDSASANRQSATDEQAQALEQVGVWLPPSLRDQQARIQQAQQAPQQAQTQQAQLTEAQSALSGVSSSASLGSSGGGFGLSDPTSMMAWEMMGEMKGGGGGPAFIRNWALRSYGLQQSLKWSQGAVGSLQQSTQEGGLLSRLPGFGTSDEGPAIGNVALERLSGALTLAQQHPAATMAAAASMEAIKGLNDQFQNAAQIGQSYGWGPGPGGPGFLGFRNPAVFASAGWRAGEATNLETQLLMGRGPGGPFGLTSPTAHQVTDVLAGQGFRMAPNLDPFSSEFQHSSMNVIAQNLFRPLMKQFPGLSAEDVAQFTPTLRNAGTSIQQLKDALGSLDEQSRTTYQSVGQMASALADFGNEAGAMGANPGQAVATASGFTNVTGLAPQYAGQFLQSPLMQGLAISQYGVLPSGLGQINPGAFSGLAESEIQMLQRATQGFNHPVYGTALGIRGPIESGHQAQVAQMAAIANQPYAVIQRMMRQERHDHIASQVEMVKGFMQNALDQSRADHTGLPQAMLQRDWSRIQQNYRRAGITPHEWANIQKQSGWQHRLTALDNALNNYQQRSKFNQIANNPNDLTLSVKFTGLAGRMFQAQNKINIPKQAANAAQGPSMNNVTNSPMGTMPYSPGLNMGADNTAAQVP